MIIFLKLLEILLMVNAKEVQRFVNVARKNSKKFKFVLIRRFCQVMREYFFMSFIQNLKISRNMIEILKKNDNSAICQRHRILGDSTSLIVF